MFTMHFVMHYVNSMTIAPMSTVTIRTVTIREYKSLKKPECSQMQQRNQTRSL